MTLKSYSFLIHIYNTLQEHFALYKKKTEKTGILENLDCLNNGPVFI